GGVQGQRQAAPLVLPELRRPGRDRRRRGRDRRRRGRRETPAREGHREGLRTVPRRAGHARRRHGPAVLRRAAAVQLPDLAGGVRRVRRPGHVLAGVRPAPPVVRVRAVRQAGPQVRRRPAQPDSPTQVTRPASTLLPAARKQPNPLDQRGCGGLVWGWVGAGWWDTLGSMKVRVRGLTFDVAVDGPDGGAPVLLLHGFPQNSTMWD